MSGVILARDTDYRPFPLMLLGVCGMGMSFGMMAILTYLDVGLSLISGPAFRLVAGFQLLFTSTK